MADIRSKYVTPAIDQTAFNCAHCGVLTTQSWFKLSAERLESDKKPPSASFEHVATNLKNLLERDKSGDNKFSTGVRAWAECHAFPSPLLA